VGKKTRIQVGISLECSVRRAAEN